MGWQKGRLRAGGEVMCSVKLHCLTVAGILVQWLGSRLSTAVHWCVIGWDGVVQVRGSELCTVVRWCVAGDGVLTWWLEFEVSTADLTCIVGWRGVVRWWLILVVVLEFQIRLAGNMRVVGWGAVDIVLLGDLYSWLAIGRGRTRLRGGVFWTLIAMLLVL